MTVAELIAELQKQPQDAEVLLNEDFDEIECHKVRLLQLPLTGTFVVLS